MFQSTRPCGARHRRRLLHRRPRVSIHAPLWGATYSFFLFKTPVTSFNPRALVGRDTFNVHRVVITISVSIHAPLWGATRLHLGILLCHGCFNPRALVGRDTGQRGTATFLTLVSIHAPLWGATLMMPVRCPRMILFQSTRPCGARHLCTGHCKHPAQGFNPRALVGRDRRA